MIDKLRSSPEYEEKIAGVVRRGLRHPLLHDYTANVWRITKERLLTDTTSADSKAVAKLNDAIHIFSKVLMQEETVRNKLNHWMRSFATETIVARRDIIAALVQRVIQKWDAETISRKFELHVGKDLQYIRINGTLVGGLVGLVLHTLSLALQ